MLSLFIWGIETQKLISKKSIVSYTKASMVLNYFIPCLQGYFIIAYDCIILQLMIRLIKD